MWAKMARSYEEKHTESDVSETRRAIYEEDAWRGIRCRVRDWGGADLRLEPQVEHPIGFVDGKIDAMRELRLLPVEEIRSGVFA